MQARLVTYKYLANYLLYSQTISEDLAAMSLSTIIMSLIRLKGYRVSTSLKSEGRVFHSR